MPQELPIACSLAADEADVRTTRWQALAASALVDSQRTEVGARQIYEPGAATERELRSLIALEAQCCAFLDFDLTSDARGLVLDVTGPPEAAPIVEMFAAR